MTTRSALPSEPPSPSTRRAASFAGGSILRLLAPFGRVPGPRTLALTCVLALSLRLVIAVVTHGSNDINTWARFGNLVLRKGVLQTYVLDGKFNHPPLMGWYAALAFTLARALNAPFDFLFKILPILASTGTVYMVQRMAQLKLGWLLLFAINPMDVLISAYHGNTDCACVAACLLSVLLADRGRPWAAGFALGAGLNVKLIPVVLIAPLALSLAPRQMWRFSVALALCALPFLPILLGPWPAFQRNAIDYNSSSALWGVGLVISTLDGRLQPLAPIVQGLSLSWGKPLILGASFLLGLSQARRRVFTRAELVAIAFSCFLVIAPGFGVQYLVYPGAYLAAARARGAFGYLYLAGACAFLIYFGYWTGTWPAFSYFSLPFDRRSVLVGFLVWLWLARYLARAIWRVPYGAALAVNPPDFEARAGTARGDDDRSAHPL